MEYSDVSKRYPVFYYHDFAIIESAAEFHVQFDFEIEGLSHFNPDFILEKPPGSITYANLRKVREAAFSLGLIELVSYWKITCSPTVIVECGSLNKAQISWWKTLYFNGLKEFFEANQITADPELFMNLKSTGEPITGHIDQRRFSGNLIPSGGGKDSCVSLQLLSGMKDENYVFVINHVISAMRCAVSAGYHGEHLIVAERSLDSRMLEFNKAGFLNGKTPFSALCAFAASLTAVIYGIQNICASNEASANESAQYSDTYEFECDFKWYIDHFITPEVHYFSLLRPLSELQTAGLFSTLKEYHPIFCSCKTGRKEERWCGHCRKCLLNCVLLSAYLDDAELESIFHTNMLNDPAMQGIFDQLCGISEQGQALSAGMREDVNAAAAMSIGRHIAEGKELPLLYQNYRNSSFYELYKDKQTDWNQYNTENMVPENYEVLLKQWMMEMSR